MENGERVLRHAGEAGVDYDAIKGDDLDAALAAVASADLEAMGRDEAYAFLINAYNLCALDAVRRRLYRDNRRIGSLRNPLTWLRFFLFTPVRVAGRRVNLYSLEYRLLKPHLRRDPRGHFAIVCASTGCPPLRDGLYHGDTLDAELELSGKAFMRSARLDKEANTLWLSRVLKWFTKDFASIGTPLEVYCRYAPEEDATWARSQRPTIRWLRYDWDLNIAKP